MDVYSAMITYVMDRCVKFFDANVEVFQLREGRGRKSTSSLLWEGQQFKLTSTRGDKKTVRTYKGQNLISIVDDFGTWMGEGS